MINPAVVKLVFWVLEVEWVMAGEEIKDYPVLNLIFFFYGGTEYSVPRYPFKVRRDCCTQPKRYRGEIQVGRW